MKQASYTLFWLGFVLSSVFLQGVRSSVHHYFNKQFAASQNGFVFYGGSEGMHASTSPGATTGGVSNGRSYIRFDTIKFKRPFAADHAIGGPIQAIIFDAADRDKVGGADAICCTSDLAKSEGCKEGEVMVTHSQEDPTWPFTISTYFEGDALEAYMRTKSVNISKTGFYSIFFAFCDPQLKALVIDGTTIWKNPMGYLPGSMAPLIGFYGVMSLAYVVLGVAWFFRSLSFWKDMSKLQNHLTVIIALSMLEVTLWYFEYTNFNATGQRPVGITVWAVSVGVVKKTLSRLLLLAISLGYGVVRPGLGSHTFKVVVLGVTYFLAAEVLDVFENVGTINDLSGKTKLLLVLPVSALDGLFVLWTVMSLSKTLEKLEAKKWTVKLELYRKITNTVSACLMIAVAWIGYEFYFKTTDAFGEKWQSAWIISAFWSILTFALLCALCVLLAPSSNVAKFDYTEETARDFDEEEAIPLNLVVVEPEKSNTKVEKKERKFTFSIEESLEEDKRE